MILLIMDHCVGKRGSLLAQIQALNWPSWELRCHAWALCHMWVFESLLLHFWASYWFPQTLAKSTESSSSISHPSPLALAIFWGFSLKVLHFSVFKTFSDFFFLNLKKWYFVTKIVLTYCGNKMFKWSYKHTGKVRKMSFSQTSHSFLL